MTRPLSRRWHRWTFVAAVFVAACAPLRTTTLTPPGPAACRTALTPEGSVVAAHWLSLGPAGDREEQDRWCRMVGSAVYVAGSAKSPREPVTFDNLTIASWNVAVGGGDVEAVMDGLLENGDAPSRAIVLLLQEAYREDPRLPRETADGSSARRIEGTPTTAARESIVALATRRGWFAFYAPSMRNGADAPEDRGNAILSTVPLSDLTVVELPFEYQRRAAVVASVPDVSVDGHPLRVASVHLDTQSGWRRGRLLWFGRERQAAALVDYLKGSDSASIGPGGPLVLGGDFNTLFGELEPAYRVAVSNFPDTPRVENHVTFPLLGAVGVHLDHLFVSLPRTISAKVVRLNERHGSDHFPLRATFAFRS